LRNYWPEQFVIDGISVPAGCRENEVIRLQKFYEKHIHRTAWIILASHIFLAVLLSFALLSANAAEPVDDPKTTEELAKESQNPIANLISVPFQNNFNFGVGPNDATQWILNVQPVIPITLNKDWNLITRTIVPIINQPSPAAGIPSASGLGDINASLFFSPANSSKLLWGVGPTMTFPTETDSLWEAASGAPVPPLWY
jgi:hypothetical protein